MLVNLYYLFGSLSLIVKTASPGDFTPNKGNGKLKLWLSNMSHTLQLYVVPTTWLCNVPSLTKAEMNRGELMACAHECDFRHDSKSPLAGGCYVSGYREVRGILRRVNRLMLKEQNPVTPLEPGNYLIRATVWGDISRLPVSSHEILLPLLEHAGVRLGYTAGWRDPSMQAFKGLLQASTQDAKQFLEAVKLGWAPYHGDSEADLSELREASRVFKCPVAGGDRNNPIGCSTCALRCNGQRPIMARHA